MATLKAFSETDFNFPSLKDKTFQNIFTFEYNILKYLPNIFPKSFYWSDHFIKIELIHLIINRGLDRHSIVNTIMF